MKKKLTALLLLCAIFATFLPTLTSCGHEHAYTIKKIIKPATCREGGIAEYSCSCGEKITEKIPKAHIWGKSECGEIQTCTVEKCGFTTGPNGEEIEGEAATRINPENHSLDYMSKTCKNCHRPVIKVNLPEGDTTITLRNGTKQVSVIRVKVESVSISSNSITIYWEAEKIANNSTGEDNDALTSTALAFRLMDKDDYVIASGTDSAPLIAVGDKVRNHKFTINGLTIWGEYTLEFADVYQ